MIFERWLIHLQLDLGDWSQISLLVGSTILWQNLCIIGVDGLDGFVRQAKDR